jgi:hypothetical protein
VTPTPVLIRRVTGQVLSASLLEIAAVGLGIVLVLSWRGSRASEALRWGLVGVTGGLIGYDLYALGVPGVLRASTISEQWGGLIATTAGCVLALVGGFLWRRLARTFRRGDSQPAS